MSLHGPAPRGLLVLHGNRLELLAEAVFAWQAAHPLPPLEAEVFLVQSTGMAEWLKMEQARLHGVCAATRHELPARFLWRAYRAVLGSTPVPLHAPLDKTPLTWRLLEHLPRWSKQPGFEALAGFLAPPGEGPQGGSPDPIRLWQLAQRLADLLDQYQVHRSDWLQDWAQAGTQSATATLRASSGRTAVPPDQAWQPRLWRDLLRSLSPAERQASRVALQQRFVQTLLDTAPGDNPPPRWPGLPTRLVVFGSTHIPSSTLEALAALARHIQVLVAVPNPCRYHWADTLSGRELLRASTRRHPLRGAVDPANLAPEALHAYGHPLLSQWGRQSRDCIAQLDAYAAQGLTRIGPEPERIDLFDPSEPHTLLEQVQAAVRDLLPLAEHPAALAVAQGKKPKPVPPEDRSLVFHSAHSAQREVEVLHDQLLQVLAQDPPPGRPRLQPRDIVVMVPDIAAFAPAIRAVFGQLPGTDARYIPWGLADQAARGQHPLWQALEGLLGVRHRRLTRSDVRDWFEAPALAQRFGLRGEDWQVLDLWLEQAGVRWGLHAAHRADLGLAAAGDTATWHFGLQRLLLGYATGALPHADGHADCEPYAEVAGLQAELAGQLACFLERLNAWWADAASPRTPQAWVKRLQALLDDFFRPSDDTEGDLLTALREGLAQGLQSCETARFQQPIALDVWQQAWFAAVAEPGTGQRFRAGGVTFCTLLPLRAIPFEVVCLLGMNDVDYPRRGQRSDFDLMALPGLQRPGDRARRDDDRQLMLDAVLSARRQLYISWSGRSQRDNSPQPPSVLVAQLQDYLRQGWGDGVLAARSTEHPLQPFSRRYFETPSPGQPALFTFASEWRRAHEAPEAGPLATVLARGAPLAASPALSVSVSVPAPAPSPISLRQLHDFLRNPVRAFFRHRLNLFFEPLDEADPDDEAFALDGLLRWGAAHAVLQAVLQPAGVPNGLNGPAVPPTGDAPSVLSTRLEREIERQARAGHLPLGAPGRVARQALFDLLHPMLLTWQDWQASHPDPDRSPEVGTGVQGELAGGLIDLQRALGLDLHAATLPPLRLPGPAWIDVQPSTWLTAKQPRPAKLLGPWLNSLVLAAAGRPAEGLLVGRGQVLTLRPIEPQRAQAQLRSLVQAYREASESRQPWPTAVETGVAGLRHRRGDTQADPRLAFEGSRHQPGRPEGQDPSLARLFPDFETLRSQPDFEACSERLYADYLDWLDDAEAIVPHTGADTAQATEVDPA